MRYYIDLFSPETAKAFADSSQDVTGFRISRKTYVENQKIGLGDRFICYVTRIQRFIGVLEIQSDPYIDNIPILTAENDPFVLRFKVKTLVWLPLEKSIPIHIDELWNNLSFTKGLAKDNLRWIFMVRGSPKLWPQKDCELIEKALLEQSKIQKDYSFSEEESSKLKPQKIRVSDKKEIIVSVPEEEVTEEIEIKEEDRKAIAIQAKLAEIGEKLGLKIWLPNSDRVKVLSIWKPKNEDILLNELPLVFDDTTLKTIRNIDVLWIKGRSIVRAFEVEHTTSIYSGILRMADLLALQPMLNIKIHIVAPSERKEAVFRQITRPVFSLIGENSLSEVCSYISYDSIIELAQEERLEFMNDTIVDEYSEFFGEQ
ncbi:MAG: hypothetical protein N3A72_06035 [bacterium]|nr:hypothetical protein [bacterium]